jgi:hypothetical protein
MRVIVRRGVDVEFFLFALQVESFPPEGSKGIRMFRGEELENAFGSAGKDLWGSCDPNGVVHTEKK